MFLCFDAIEDLCLHEEYVHPLQEGVNRVAPKGSYSHLGATPLLDSFLRGSIRCTNSGASTWRL
ncbi:hypothetical protein ASPBRDRAFT_39199 [Aspergillus brasiliensis CBS 101740]|uniref:Uncharacterized protein n=1 Tax=Aspergillus brasiliensis (strain CBS 101740 / IMI 381727 / IBT 21946) TaxID=767769 RepID=A0A1L9UYI6_ASPBC|nr:hypothetical protein ASPBRDRAFT_39199 [Aspergillus brasiliensis CBS 101740]